MGREVGLDGIVLAGITVVVLFVIFYICCYIFERATRD